MVKKSRLGFKEQVMAKIVGEGKKMCGEKRANEGKRKKKKEWMNKPVRLKKELMRFKKIGEGNKKRRG